MDVDNASGTRITKTEAVSTAPELRDYTEAETGTCIVLLNADSGLTGCLAFSCALDGPGVALAAGTAVTTTVKYKGQNAGYTFAATAGQHVTFDVTAANWADGKSVV